VYAEESVIYRVRERWPRIYPAARSLLARLEAPSGGIPAYNQPSLAGRAANLARRAARRWIGVAPLVRLDVATRATVETLQTLADVPGLPVFCRLTVGGVRDSEQAAEMRRRIDQYNSTVIEACELHGFRWLDVAAELASVGRDYTFEPDGLHGDLAVREFTANLVAQFIEEQVRATSGGS
jgi:hypothetical protein